MSVNGVAGFWSYSHQDDERDGHGITRLAGHIMDEFALVTGETLTLFLDRNDIRWGEEWRYRIETSLAETTFFIPIITPLYFKRQECRRELLSFVGQAQSLGAIELVMPILYVDVPGLTEESADEVCALVARMQHVDWRHIRLTAEDSAEYRREVNSLATRLAEISNEYEQHSTLQASEGERSNQNGVEEEEEEGILDIIGVVEPKIIAWKELVDDGFIINRQFNIVQKSFAERMLKAEKSGASSGAVLNIIRTFCSEAEPLERRSIEKAEAYSSASVELDPLILTLLRRLSTYPEFGQLPPALLPIEEVYNSLEEFERENQKALAEQRRIWNRYKGMSKDLSRLLRLILVEDRLIGDANSIMANWHQEIKKYLEDTASGRSPEAEESIHMLENFLKTAQGLGPDSASDTMSN